MKNERGFAPIMFLVMIFFLFSVLGFFDAGSERYALAEDVESGKLILTNKALTMIEKGDLYLNYASHAGYDPTTGERRNDYMSTEDNDLFKAFIAKVWYERARLEMEINK